MENSSKKLDHLQIFVILKQSSFFDTSGVQLNFFDEIGLQDVDELDDATVGSPLYVVENGKEYRLVSLHERMQMFEPQKSRVSKTKPDVHAIPEITVEHSKEEHQVGHI